MRRVFFLIVAAVLTANLCVQKTYGQFKVSVGARAGANFTKFGGSDAKEFAELFDEIGLDMKDALKPGFQLGVVASAHLVRDRLMIQPGIIFAQQGARWTASESDDGVKYKLDVAMPLNYIQIPINVICQIDLASNMALMLQAGPYTGYGINGKIKAKLSATDGKTSVNRSEEEDLVFGIDEDLSFIDFGVGIGAGLLIMEKIHFSVGYNLGLANIASDVKMQNRGVAVTLAFMFN